MKTALLTAAVLGAALAGQDSHAFGADWYVLSPAGTTIESDGS